MKKILTVIGARPQFIKAAPVSKAFKKNGGFNEILVHTGQHYDDAMSQVFFDELEIPAPLYNLGIGSGGHGEQTGEMLKRLEPLMVSEKPDLVLVYGDTNSTLAGTLAASKLHFPVAHVEAGLRSFNRKMPEEINRIVTDHLSSILFCPTRTAIGNLTNEGITQNVHHVGDVMYDSCLMFAEKAKSQSTILPRLGIAPKEFILVTVHRAENTDEKSRLLNILSALGSIAEETPVVLPLHPRTKKMVEAFELNSLLKKIKVIEPVGYLDMVCLESNAKLIMTDSGGVQKEAYFHKVPCVTLRNETEWVETVEAGWNMVASGVLNETIVRAVAEMMQISKNRKPIEEYGDGNGSHSIANIVAHFQ